MDRRGAELDHRFHGTCNVEGRRTETGIDIDQQRQVADVGDATHVGQHVIEVGNAEVGQAQRTGGHAAARQVDGAEAGALGQQGMVGVDGTDDLQRRLFFHRLPEARARGLNAHELCPVKAVSVG